MGQPRGWAAALLALGLSVGGCAAEPGPPLPAVPAIDMPKDLRGADPCVLVGPAALVELGITGAGVPAEAAEGRRCVWAGGSRTRLTVTLYTDGGGLATLAENSEPTTSRVRIEGYPALETFTEGGRFCQYDVAVAPQQVLMVALENGVPDSCTALQEVFPEVLGELPR